MGNRALATIAVVVATTLAACAVGPNYKRPNTPVAQQFAGAEPSTYQTAQETPAQFWKQFDDETLDQLVSDALTANHDLRIALGHLVEARAARHESMYDLAPTVTASAGHTNELVPKVQAGFPFSTSYYDAGFDATWELDLFGRVRRGVEARTAELQGAEASLQDAQVSVVAEVARTYFELRGQQTQLEVAQRNVVNQTDTLKLTQARESAGRGTELDTSRAQSQLSTTLSTIAPLQAAVARSIHRLGVLTGREPDALTEQLAPARDLPELPRITAINDPATLLRRRPDIRVAERQLAASTAQVGVAIGDYFPKVTFTGNFTYAAAAPSNLGSSPSRGYVIGPGITWAAFDLGRVHAQVAQAHARNDVALATYEKTVLDALEEAENTLITHARDRDSLTHVEAAAESSARAAKLARTRYEGGYVDFLEVLDAERTQLEAEDRLAQSRTETATSLIAVYKAMGGGWEQAPYRATLARRIVSDAYSMNATLARLEPAAFGSPQCAEELTQINESLQRRESLLSASAKASRLLLEAPDVRAVIPKVLRLIGEAATVDRVNLMLTKAGPKGEPLLSVANEWVAEGVVPHLDDPTMSTCDERDFSAVCSELRAGRSVCLSKSDTAAEYAAVGFEGIGTKTKAIVPIFVASEFIGIVGFDNTKQRRAIDTAELAALETAAGVIGAALHRERLVDDVRRERERAAEERVTELAKANQVIRGNLERLASEPDLGSFMGHMLLEAVRQFDADSGAVIVSKDSLQEWRIVAHVKDGQLQPAPFATSVPFTGSPFTNMLVNQQEPVYFDLEKETPDIWPGALAFHRREGYSGVVVYPLVFGARNVGFFILSFRRNAQDVQRSELLVALAQQATLAVQLTRLAYSAKEAAVLVERTRIGQEIHDGLAQSFTGILMQLGAAEEFPPCKRKNSELNTILSRIRDLARDGLSEARRSVMALRLDQTRRAGLEIALRQLAERSSVPGGVTVTFEGAGIATGLKPEHEHELLRISQEAVSNAVRHGRPHTVAITMQDAPSHWELAVADDGVGMEEHPEHYASEGFGLTSMRQRAGAIGGEWHIDSRPGAGTRVSVRMAKRRP